MRHVFEKSRTSCSPIGARHQWPPPLQKRLTRELQHATGVSHSVPIAGVGNCPVESLYWLSDERLPRVARSVDCGFVDRTAAIAHNQENQQRGTAVLQSRLCALDSTVARRSVVSAHDNPNDRAAARNRVPIDRQRRRRRTGRLPQLQFEASRRRAGAQRAHLARRADLVDRTVGVGNVASHTKVGSPMASCGQKEAFANTASADEHRAQQKVIFLQMSH